MRKELIEFVEALETMVHDVESRDTVNAFLAAGHKLRVAASECTLVQPSPLREIPAPAAAPTLAPEQQQQQPQ